MNELMVLEVGGPRAIVPQDVIGWGVDADSKNDPTYPYRDRSADDHSGLWVRPVEQNANVEILQSIEYLRRPAVVGTSTPPSGISGSMRRLAFRWNESNLLHWMLLLGADRVNVVEGVAHDLSRGKVPNVLGEMGIKAEFKHNKLGLLAKVALFCGVVVAARAVSRRKRRLPGD